MQHSSRFFRALVLGIFGFGAAVFAPCVRADEGIESKIGFGTQNLLQNGDFSGGITGWNATGDGLKIRLKAPTAILDLAPASGASPSRLSLSQTVGKPIRGGTTLCFRFSARGDARLAFQIYELGSKKPIIAHRLRAPKTYSANDNTLRTFTFAAVTPRAYFANELGIQFYLGYDAGQLELANLRLLDLGQTPLGDLPLTPDETQLPDLMASKSQVEEKLKIAPVEAPKPIEEKVPEKPVVVAPAAPRFGPNLLKNADFSERDAHWNAWGNGVNVQLQGNLLKMRLSPPTGANPWDFGLSQKIGSPLRKGKLQIRFRAQGNVRFLCKLEERTGEKHKLFEQRDQATFDGKEHLYTVDLPRDYNADEVEMALLFAFDAGDLTVSDFSVTGEEN